MHRISPVLLALWVALCGSPAGAAGAPNPIPWERVYDDGTARVFSRAVPGSDRTGTDLGARSRSPRLDGDPKVLCPSRLALKRTPVVELHHDLHVSDAIELETVAGVQTKLELTLERAACELLGPVL